MQKYLKASTEKQLRANITPKQAVPLFLSKLLLLARYLSWKIAERSVNPSGLFVLARDQAFFKALFFSDDRGSDLGMIRTERSCVSPRTMDCCLIMYWENPARWRFQWIGSAQPEKFRKKVVHLWRWTSFLGWNGSIEFHLTIPTHSQSQDLAVRYLPCTKWRKIIITALHPCPIHPD